MIGILDVLVAIEAAKMPGDEPVLMVNTEPLGIGLHREPLARELGRHRVAVGIQSDAELSGRAQVEHPRQIIGIRIRGSQEPAFLGKEVNGAPVRLAVLAHVGDLVEPRLRGRIDGREVGEVRAVQEVLL